MTYIDLLRGQCSATTENDSKNYCFQFFKIPNPQNNIQEHFEHYDFWPNLPAKGTKSGILVKSLHNNFKDLCQPNLLSFVVV